VATTFIHKWEARSAPGSNPSRHRSQQVLSAVSSNKGKRTVPPRSVDGVHFVPLEISRERSVEIKSETISIRELLELRKIGMLKVNPEYQRAAVWTEAQQKKLIDSVLRRYPLPLFYFHHKVRSAAGMRSEHLEIIDGQQRINALYRFAENGLRLFDPIRDDKVARFPNFIKESACPWAQCDFLGLPTEFKSQFFDTAVFVVKATTEVEDEARDLFIRLQAGLPLNAQEKRDAWPGGFTELVLKLGGKQEIERYPGHDFFRHLVKRSSRDRGAERQLCAQICMLYLERAAQGNWIDIGTQDIDDYYYRNLGFDVNDPRVTRLSKVLDLVVELFDGKGEPKLRAYEAIHLVLLLDGLTDDYTKAWRANFIPAYDAFKTRLAQAKKDQNDEYWTEFGAWTQTQSAGARTIQRRHAFFLKEMYQRLNPVLRDPTRMFGEIEREIVYYQYDKLCGWCGELIRWPDLEIHHVEEHQAGGRTSIENAAPVHKDCHPKGPRATGEFKVRWLARKSTPKARQTGDTSGSVREPRSTSSLPPEGTRCRFIYGSKEYRGTVADGRIEIDEMPGRVFGSFSAASGAVTDTSRNGWRDWEILVPESDDWVLADTWRNSLGGD
jgi:5-methylcytosine-specific restriction endonuclease McrA